MNRLLPLNRPNASVLASTVCVAAVTSLLTAVAHADYITDFGDLTPGALHGQDGWVVDPGTGSGTTTVVESDPLFPSPSSLQYVVMQGGRAASGGAEAMTTSHTFTDAPTTGLVAFEFVWAYRTPRSNTDNMFRAYLTGAANSSIGAMLFFRDLGNGTASIIYPDSDVSANFHQGAVVATVNPDEFYRIRVEFDGGASAGTGHLPGTVNVAVYNMDNELVGQVSDRTFYQNVSENPGVDTIRFYDAGWGDQVFYIDSVSIRVIPEPAAAGLFVTGGMLALSRRTGR